MSQNRTEHYQPSSYSTASAADRRVRQMKGEGNLTLLSAMDKLILPETFAQFLVGRRGELPELAAEMNRTPFIPEKFVAELNDVMVFVFSWYISHGVHLDLSNVPYSRNTKGNMSRVIDELEQLSWEFLSDAKAGVEIAEVTSSMMYYANLPGPHYRLYQNFDLTIARVLANRQPKYYGDKDYFSFQKLTENQVQQKYAFNEKVMRTLRDGRPDPDRQLSEADVQPWHEYLLAWNVDGMLDKFLEDFAARQTQHQLQPQKMLVWSPRIENQKVKQKVA